MKLETSVINCFRINYRKKQLLQMKILGLKNWSWIFFEEEDNKYLEVVCGTVGLYTVIIKLNEEASTNVSLFPFLYVP